MSFDYDLIVIGSGPGGYVSAIHSAKLGMKTIVIEKDKLGGVCLNIGCIPSKSLIHQAELFSTLPEIKKMGIGIDLTNFSYEKTYLKSRKAVTILLKGIDFLFKKYGVDLKYDTAKISGDHQVCLENGNKITAKHILIATGSYPAGIPNFSIDEETVISSTGALMLKQLPEKMLIIGGGTIGIEMAYIFNSFGVEINLIEILNKILPLEDAETVQVLHNALSKQGIKISTSTKAIKMKKSSSSLTVKLEKDGLQEEIKTNKILIAAGRIPNTNNIGLEAAGIKTEKKFIPVNDVYQTKNPNIFAIGDIVNTPQLAHVASKEGSIAIEYMAGNNPQKLDLMTVPNAVYCKPQIASFGHTEESLKKKNMPYKKVTSPYAGCGKATAMEEREGHVKILYEPDTKKILGAHIVGAEAVELIHELLIIKKGNSHLKNISCIPFAHPTLSEIIMEAAQEIDNSNVVMRN